MRMRQSGAVIIAMVVLASPALCAPALQQIGHAGATEVIIYTDSAKAVVRQEMFVRLTRGTNTVGLEWNSDSVDATSIRLHGGGGLEIGEVVKPAGADKLLHWTVRASATGDYALTTSFLLAGLKWSTDYWLGYAPERSEALLGGWLTLTNESGMDLENLTARLVLGRPGASNEEQAVFPIPDLAELPAASSIRAGFLPGTSVPIRTIHRIDTESAPETVRRILEITPPSEGPLARTPLPSGPMTIITPTEMPPADMMKATLGYQPSEAFEVALGDERDVVVERRLLERRKTAVEFDRLGQVSGFDTVESYEVSVRSHLDDPIEIELVETVLETWDLQTDALHVLEDGKAVMLLPVAGDGEAALEFALVKHSGSRIP